MKILITTDLYTTATNGVVTSIRNLCDELVKKGHEVRILTLSESMHSHKKDSVSYVRSMPLKIYPDVRVPLSFRHRLIKEMIRWKPDVIHTQCELCTMQFAKRIAKKTKAPIVHTYHTMYEQYVGYLFPGERFGNWFVRTVIRRQLKPVSTIIVPTKKMEKVLTGYGIQKPMWIVPSGICIEQHKKRISEKARKAKRESLGLSEEHLVLINLGRLGTEKNLEEVLEYFAKAGALNEQLRLLIVGGGPAKESLEKQAKSLGIQEKVVFTGMVKPSEVHKYYQLGDIFISASTSETQGLTYIEAAANGLPLLCRKDPCLEGVIDQGENGYAYNNLEDFLEALDVIVKNPDWRKSAKNKSESIAAAYDKESFGTVVEKVYQSVLGS